MAAHGSPNLECRMYKARYPEVDMAVMIQEQGISVLSKAIADCTEAIELQKGKLTVKELPRAVSERDDKLLAEHIAKVHMDNEEISEDEDREEEEDTGMGDADVESGAGITE